MRDEPQRRSELVGIALRTHRGLNQTPDATRVRRAENVQHAFADMSRVFAKACECVWRLYVCKPIEFSGQEKWMASLTGS